MDELINWYPGHMAKARRMLEQNLKVIELVIEVLDARAPKASRNPVFEPLFQNKARLILLNKADLADKEATKAWAKRFAGEGLIAAPFTATAQGQKAAALKLVNEAAKPLLARYAAKGVKKTVRAMVVGIPNVGKSAVINAIAGAARAGVGNKPGVTRGKQWVKIHDYFELMDTPGLLWPKLDDQEGALHLAYLNAINDEILRLEPLAISLLTELNSICPQKLTERYKTITKDMSGENLLTEVCRSRGYLMRGAEPDTLRAARNVLDEFRLGKIANVTFELPERQDEQDRG